MKQLRELRTLLWVAAIVLVALGLFAAFALLREDSPYQISAATRSQAGFSIVLPSQLPKDSLITNPPAYDNERKALITSIKLAKGAITISQQAKPVADLKQIDAKETYLVSVGAVYVLKGEAGRIQAIVETSDSWVILNSTESFGTKPFRELTQTLTEV